LLAPAIARSGGRYDATAVQRCLNDRSMQLWIAADAGRGTGILAACVTEIVDYPNGRRCGLVFCGGSGRERWVHWLGAIEVWARTRGCTGMEIHGRRGWARVLPGYAVAHTIIEKELR
jgi:hypothetical protein